MNRPLIILATTLSLLVALPAAAQAKKKPVRRAVPPVVAPLVLPPAAGEQLEAAALTHFGDYNCEFGKSLRVSPNPTFDGYVDLLFDKQVYTLKPVLSHTGALRLEDVRGRLLLLQISVKSMLMDIKIGHRLVDDCVHTTQSENRRVLAAAPAQPGLGIDPDKAAADAAAQAASAAAVTAAAPAQAAAVAPGQPASAVAVAPGQPASAVAVAPGQPASAVAVAPGQPASAVATAPEPPASAVAVAPEQPASAAAAAPEQPASAAAAAPSPALAASSVGAGSR